MGHRAPQTADETSGRAPFSDGERAGLSRLIRRPRSLFWTFAGSFLLVLLAAALLQAVFVMAVVKPITSRWLRDRAALTARVSAEELAALQPPVTDESISRILHEHSDPPNLRLLFRFDDGRAVFDRFRPGGDGRRPEEHREPPPGSPSYPGGERRPGWAPDEGKPDEPGPRHDSVRREVTLSTGESGEVVAVIFNSRFSVPRGGPALPLLLFLPVAILVAGGGGLILFRSFTRRLRALEGLATRVTEGDLAARIEDLGADEIGRLGTRLNRMTEAIGEAQGRIEENDRQRRRLFADITHDLATPLTSIRGYAETLLNPDVHASEKERHAYLEDILEESKRLDLLIKDLFELARLEAEAVSLTLEPLDWAALCRHTAARFESRFRDAGLQLEWGMTGGEAWVQADGRRLEQMLENLLTNALRYVPSGGHIRLALEAVPERGAHRLTVSDDGPGFAPQDLPHVFDRFYRGDAARSSSGGTGLGLAIVQEIVLRHGGSIRAENLDPRGAAIHVELPGRPAGG